MPALFAVWVFVVLIGGVGITRADQAPAGEETAPKPAAANDPPKSDPALPPASGRLIIRAVSAATGAPIEGATVKYRLHWGEEYKDATRETGEDGSALLEYDPNVTLAQFTLWVNKPGFVPAHVYKDGSLRPLALPAQREFRLEPGTTIGGVVRDEAGKPIEGATVQITMPPTESDMANYVFHIGSPKTDAEGRWQIGEAPADLGRVSIAAEHPRYRRGYAQASRGHDAAIVLTRGLTVRGSVVDAGGKPVKGAKVVLGHDIWGSRPPKAKTDAEGAFTLENCNPGPSIVTVQAERFAPAFRDVRVEAKGETAPVALRLEPGSVIRVRVVDEQGKPVPKADFGADAWRGNRSIRYDAETDIEGRVAWTSAPKDAVQYYILQSGYMNIRDIPLVASDTEQLVVLHPELTLSGRVTDAKTGAPVPEFQIIRGMTFAGREEVSWSRNEPAEFTGGRYVTTIDEPMTFWHLRVEAPGYKPADSRPFRSDEGRQTFDFALEPAAGLGGVVLLPDGTPAAGVEVALATPGVSLSLRGSQFDRQHNFPIAKTGSDGRFAFPSPDEPCLLAAAGAAGFADAVQDEFVKSGKLVLKPWGRVEGIVRIGAKPGAGQPVAFSARAREDEPERQGFFVNYGYELQAGSDGRFVFEKVVPGPATVTRVVITEFVGGSREHMFCWQEPVEVPAGATVSVTIGGKGRAVVGRVVVDGTPETPLDWRQNSPAQITLPRSRLGEGPRRWDRFAANIDQDGRFRIDDVPPGDYTLQVPVNTPPDPRSCGAGAEIGRASRDFTVPAARTISRVDLGTVTAKLAPTLKAGDLAPDFTAQRLDGGSLKRSDSAGKLVFLDFWATWCGPCLAEMPTVKEIQATFGADPRFLLVGMSCDEERDEPARYVRENGLNWTQAFAGALNAGVAETYRVKSIPATFLIGPDGRILAKNLRGDALKEAVRSALK